MEDTGLQLLLSLLVLPYAILFIAISSLIKKIFGKFLNTLSFGKLEWQPVFTVAIIGILIAIPYMIYTDVNWVPILIT